MDKPSKTSMNALRRASRGFASTVKTQVLRTDRVDDEAYQTRMAICQNCPGNHVTLKKNGQPFSCGPLLASVESSGGKTCGCLLNTKARDVKEACPNGYWPTVQNQVIEPPTQAVPGLAFDLMTRRHFMAKTAVTAASAAAATFITRPAWAGEDSGSCYVTLSQCEDENDYFAACTQFDGKEIGKYFDCVKGGETKLYQLKDVKPKGEGEIDTAKIVTWEADSTETDCPDDANCGTCSFEVDDTIDISLEEKTCSYSDTNCSTFTYMYKEITTGQLVCTAVTGTAAVFSMEIGDATTIARESFSSCDTEGSAYAPGATTISDYRYNCSTEKWQRQSGGSWYDVDSGIDADACRGFEFEIDTGCITVGGTFRQWSITNID